VGEGVRFFWCGGAGELPIAAIAEAERQPLQVRLGVLREHAPEVVHQLEQGRYVAAAWPAGGEIVLILCHPSLANGAADAVCLSTRELPRVVLKVGSWGEAPEAARLLLAAFGAEATDEQECVTARYALEDWLRKRGQGLAAGVVMRYFLFPCGVRAVAAGRRPPEPHLGPRSRVGPRAALALRAFAEKADGYWPLPEGMQPIWHEFVVQVYRDNVAFDPGELTGWFASNGWDSQAAGEMTRRLSADAALLDAYDEEVRGSPAWR
jgi:hypothetical protein